MSQLLFDALRNAVPANLTIESYLDKGGQGAVFKGRVDGIPAAIKVFAPSGNPKRLTRELDLLKSIQCPQLVRILWDGSVTLDGASLPLVAYEYHPGGDLRGLLAPAKSLPDIATILQIGRDVSIAVSALWDRRIVHRDIKPGNIVQTADGQFVLVDVGLARHLDRSEITAAGASPGTLGYKSPEQAGGRRNLTIKSDWFSLGVTLYELASRRHPFNRHQPSHGHFVCPVQLASVRSDVPDGLSRLIAELLAELPVNRPFAVAERFEQLAEEAV